MKLLNIILFVTIVPFASADTFGTGQNQFEIDFVAISGDASRANGTNISQAPSGFDDYRAFADPTYDYRIGTYEITNDQWNKFRANYGAVNGDPYYAYNESSHWTGTNVPVNNVSQYEAAQFVNWLNVSSGYQAAYNFTGEQGDFLYRLDIWDSEDAWGGTNLFRHKEAHYFLPTEDEWVKAAYWNGTTLQNYATPDGSLPVDDIDANYDFEDGGQPWNVGSGSEELNGTFDMMGNVWEWMESPYNIEHGYVLYSMGGMRGGAWGSGSSVINSSYRYYNLGPQDERTDLGFRIASVPEPATLALLGLGGLWLRKRRLQNTS